MNLELKVIDLGNVKYKEAEQLQESIAKKREKGEISDTLLIAQHPPTLTTWINKQWNIIYATPTELKRLGIEYYESSRGGGATILGPGQLIFYPIINLKDIGILIGDYMRAIEETMHDISKGMGAKTIMGKEQNSATGKDYYCVWHLNNKKEKFLAQGYNVKKEIINQGGFSIYIDKRAHEYFNLIDHCGFKLTEVGATSFEEMLGYNPGLELIKSQVLSTFQKKFGYSNLKIISQLEVAA